MRRLLMSLIALVLLDHGGSAGELVAPLTIRVPAGPFLVGSSAEERAYAYRLDEQAYGHGITREQGWYEREAALHAAATGAYAITTNLITNAEYARFVAASGHPAPDVDPATWRGYGLIHPFERTRR
ncbi:MAG TPA: SUMF1/EgtB/PvdO family nonheme iron enzyme, partial [Geminicoccaceae bacterium]|nr:SUMF1/EgtB/PvdO family nonheme iron enzyme [Geminicoccaceae bacterium]